MLYANSVKIQQHNFLKCLLFTNHTNYSVSKKPVHKKVQHFILLLVSPNVIILIKYTNNTMVAKRYVHYLCVRHVINRLCRAYVIVFKLCFMYEVKANIMYNITS